LAEGWRESTPSAFEHRRPISFARKPKSCARSRPMIPRSSHYATRSKQMIADGYTLREGGPQPRQWPLHEAWKGREPPENP